MTALIVDQLVELYRRWGAQHYDEEITQLAHAEQTAALARQAGAPDVVVAAALLHDVGHLLHLDTGIEVPHERSGPQHLAPLFPAEIVEPIALHVAAKRYLCAVDPTYHDGLSAGSVASLVRQGGPMARDEVEAFAARPGSATAVQLRRWDDTAKVDGLVVEPFASYADLLARVSLEP